MKQKKSKKLDMPAEPFHPPQHSRPLPLQSEILSPSLEINSLIKPLSGENER